MVYSFGMGKLSGASKNSGTVNVLTTTELNILIVTVVNFFQSSTEA
jgi:hypothetical protein